MRRTVVYLAAALAAASTIGSAAALAAANETPRPAPAAPHDAAPHVTDMHLAPGTYSTTVPADSTGCHWARLLAGTWDGDGQVAFDDASPGQTVVITIAAADVAFRSQGCGQWAPLVPPRPGRLA